MNDSQPPTDAELVARCRSGDAGGWTLLVQRYQRLVTAIVTRAGLDGHAAADVFQTVFVRLLDQLPRLQQPERLQAWIVTTAKREALRARARSARLVSLDADEAESAPAFELADDSPLAEQALSDLQQLHLLRLSLQALDERCRRLLATLFADEDRPPAYEQLAIRLGVPVGSIGPTRARCLDKLRRLVERASA